MSIKLEMNYYKQLRFFLWSIDPGYFRLKHAAKTILAILITLWLLEEESLLTKVIAGLACGFSMQGIVAKSYSFRVLHVVLFDVIYCAVFLLGIAVRDSSNLKALVLIGLGFAVNYIRRFGLQNSMAPLMVWMVCFLAIILPLDTLNEVRPPIYGLVVGLAVSAGVLLLVFPENYPRLFVNNSNRLFKLLAKGMRDTRRYLLVRTARQAFEGERFVRFRQNLNQLLDSNQAMEESQVFIKRKNLVSMILIHQYAIVHAYSLMIEAYRILKIHDYQLSPSVRLTLNMINRQFEDLFESLTMKDGYAIFAHKVAGSLNHLSRLTEKLNHEALTEPSVVMAILNLKLSFNLFSQHIVGLLRGDNNAS